MIEGLSHITFAVSDLERSARLIIEVLGGEQVHARPGDRFFVAGGLWLALVAGERPPGRSYDHVAFKVPPGALDGYRRRVEALGLEVTQSRPRVPGEGDSLYFHDWDGHLFELHTGTLEERLAAYRAKP